MSETANDTDNPSCSSIISESSSSTIKRVNISTDLVESGIQSAPAEILRSISNKAEELLNKNGSVVHAPGSDDGMAYMFESYTSVRPHYVSIVKNGKVTCQDCPNWKALKICAHAVAAAEILNKGPAHINITALMTSDSSSGTGKKGGKGSTARRKGGRAAERTPASAIVDRPAFMQTSATPQPSQQESTQHPVYAPRLASETSQPFQQDSMQQPVYTTVNATSIATSDVNATTSLYTSVSVSNATRIPTSDVNATASLYTSGSFSNATSIATSDDNATASLYTSGSFSNATSIATSDDNATASLYTSVSVSNATRIPTGPITYRCKSSSRNICF